MARTSRFRRNERPIAIDLLDNTALLHVVCDCGACREIEPEALARLVGWKMTLKELPLPMCCSKCGKKAAEVVAVARPRPRAIAKNLH